MNKPEDIPQDVWDAAADMPLTDSGNMDDDITLAIAVSVMAERERCAQIADSNAHADCEVAEQIAISIRKGTT